MASLRTSLISVGSISGSGLARANIKGLSAIVDIISLLTKPPLDKPKKTSEPIIAFAKSPSGISLTNSSLY